MSIIQAEIYDAFIEAGVSETKARAAATVATITTNYPKPEELATKEYIEKRVAQLEARIAELEGRMDSKMAELKVELKAEMAELKDEMAGLRVEIANLEGRMDSKMAELKVEIGNLEGRIVGLEERINTKIAELKVCLMQQNRESNRMLIAVIAVATSVIVAAIAVLAFVSQ